MKLRVEQYYSLSRSGEGITSGHRNSPCSGGQLETFLLLCKKRESAIQDNWREGQEGLERCSHLGLPERAKGS